MYAQIENASPVIIVMALALVSNGAKVYIVSRKASVTQEVAKELSSIGPGSCIPLQSADLSSKAGIDGIVQELATLEPALHILINNAGMSWGQPLTDFDEAKGWDRLLALNVKAPFYLTAGLLPLLENGAASNLDPARIINVSSVAGVVATAETPLSGPGSGTWSYNASKAALTHLSRTLAFSLADKFITVNAIAPGVFPSKMTAFGIEQGKELLEAVQPLGRIGTAEDIAGLVLFLSSKASAHITGAVIPIDGGASLGSTAYSRL
jgi:NAD(P)-dependent dehydrogenase (short-subunit alcohol dehydrogenase family)